MEPATAPETSTTLVVSSKLTVLPDAPDPLAAEAADPLVVLNA